MVRVVLFVVFMMTTTAAISQYLDFMEPQKLPAAINSEDEEIMPLLSSDGNTLFFGRILHAGNVGGRFSGSDVWTSVKTNGTWTKARNTDYPFNTKENNGVIGL